MRKTRYFNITKLTATLEKSIIRPLYNGNIEQICFQLPSNS